MDEKDNVYKKCFESCNFCYGPGDNNFNNCKECKTNYIFISNLNSTSNCYKKCEHFYYFEENGEYKCSENNNCPANYNKFIFEKSKCVDKCENDDTYKYEYGNIYYSSCPKGTIKNYINYSCLGEKSTEKFYINYNYYPSNQYIYIFI